MTKITTHVLNTTLGKPAENIKIRLYLFLNEQWTEIGTGTSDSDGRIKEWVPAPAIPASGFFKIRFETGPYFSSQNIYSFYPFIEIHFTTNEEQGHYHVPLLLNPYGYSTYRGS